jgi:DNA-binding IclR family transcriptional regulator
MTLEGRGLVEQSSERGKYRVGYTAVQLAARGAKVSDIADIGRPVCQALAEVVGETVNLAIHDGVDVITVDQALGRSSLTTVDWVGKRQPLHATAAGKVFLAHMSQDDLDAVLSKGLQRHTDATVTDPAELEKQLADVRTSGYATTYEEHEIGLVAIAVPIRALGDHVIGALTVAGPAFRVNQGAIAGLLAELEPAAAKISWRAGSIKRG